VSTYEEARAKMIKQTRREILAALAVMYGIGTMTFASICAALTHLELPDEGVVKSDLTYLCERGFVRWTNERALMGWSLRVYKLTAKGKDIHDLIEHDPALEP
jgi:hypothetical protein